MSFATARRDIEGRLTANWATTSIAYDNVPFKTPSDSTSWVRLRIFEENVTRLNIGNPGTHRVSGLIVVEIFVPQGRGTQTVRGYADTIAAVFRDQQFSGITCREATPRSVGEYEGWWQYNVSVPFYWDGVYSV